MLRALLWDVDGTFAETERDGHRVAFNLAFEAFGLPWRWSVARYRELLRITGGRERLLHDMATRTDAPVPPGERERLAHAIHQRKNALFAAQVAAGGLPPRPGVLELMRECGERGVAMAIATTTSRANAAALLASGLGPGWAAAFGAIVCGEDVRQKKPDPQVYHLALQGLALPPLQCLAIEDSPGGVAAARAADVPVLVARSAEFPHDTIEGAVAIGPGLHTRRGWQPALPDAEAAGHDGRIGLDDLIEWHQRMDLVSQFD